MHGGAVQDLMYCITDAAGEMYVCPQQGNFAACIFRIIFDRTLGK